MEMEQRGEQSISLSMSRIAEMATSAVTKREKVVKSSETERKERMDTSSLMEQILSSDNLNRAYLQVVRNKGAEGVDGMNHTEKTIPVWKKYSLNVFEAAEYYGIVEKRLRQIAGENKGADFILEVGSHIRFKRKLFEDYLDTASTV